MPSQGLQTIDGYMYFNKIQLRGPVVPLAPRIRGVEKRGKINVWRLACKTPECEGLTRYYSGSLKKGIDSNRCDACRFPLLGKTVQNEIDGNMHVRTIIKATWDPHGKKPKYYLPCASCDKSYPMQDFAGKRKRLHCFACHVKYRTLFGYYVISDDVWSRKKDIREPRILTYKGRETVIWRINCTTKGCKHAMHYRKGADKTCRHCQYKKRSLGPYVSMYRTHLRQDAQRAQKNPDWQPNRLTLKQFINAMQDDECHYCHKAVLRHERNRFTDTKGRRKTSVSFLDRVDSSLPYQKGNVVTCCTGCNVTKNAYLTEDEMLYIAAQRTGNSAQARIAHDKLSKGYEFPNPRDVNIQIRDGFRKTVRQKPR